MALHLMLDYKNGNYEGIIIADGTSPDQNYDDAYAASVNSTLASSSEYR